MSKQNDEAVWLQGDIYISKKHSLDVFNMQTAKLVSHLRNFKFDHFNPAVRLNFRLKLALLKIIKFIRFNLPVKINQYTNKCISHITWVDRYQKYFHENIVVSLEDERCQTINKII